MIQLQYYNDKFENAGGLYVKKEEVAAIYAKKVEDVFRGFLILKSGREFCFVNNFTEVLDELNQKVYCEKN